MSAQTKQNETPCYRCRTVGPCQCPPEPRIVAECWTCGESLQERIPDPTRYEKDWRVIKHPWKPHYIKSAHGLDIHRAVGHDVREVSHAD